MAIPTYVGQGSNNTGTNPTAGAVSGLAANDILILFCATANRVPTTPGGWTLIPGFYLAGGDNTGGAPWLDPGGDHAIRLYAYWKRATGSETTQSITVSDGHAWQCAIRGCIASGSPIESVNPSSGSSAWTPGSTTSFSIPGGTTLTPDCLVMPVCADSATGKLVTSWTNSDLASLTERMDNNNAGAGNIHTASGGKATAGAYGATSLVIQSNQDGIWVGASMVLRSQAPAQGRSFGIII